MTRRFLPLIFLALAGAALAAPEEPRIVHGEVVSSTKARPMAQLRLGASADPAPVVLPALTAAEVEAVAKSNRVSNTKRLRIGINRDIEAAQRAPAKAASLAWQRVEGGYAARLAVMSPEAAALRVAIDLSSAPLGAELVFFGSDARAKVMGPLRVADIADRISPWWSPPTEGATQTVEVFVPDGADTKAAGLRLVQVSHLFTSPASGFKKFTKDIGDSGSCNVDIACAANPSQGFLNTRNSVARMVFTVGSQSFLCTGTLLNDTDPNTVVPYFYSANHCFDNEDPPFRTPAQMQQVANTLTTYFFFEATACGNDTPGLFVTLTGGAAVLYSSVASDVLFLRLNDPPPNGSFLSGYIAQPMSVNQNAIDFHHPRGDLKKWSQGMVRGFATPFAGAVSNGYTRVHWDSGTTEGGSSGSGLWSNDNGEYLFRGGLWGGDALCTNTQGTDNFSRLDLAYAQLRPYLEGTTPFADFTDLWWGGPSESGWGLNLIQHPTNQVFGVWYTYDGTGKRIWYVLPGGSWTSASRFTGTLYVTAGPPYNGPFNPDNVAVTAVGTGTLDFTSATAGTWSYSVNGVFGSKSIVRQPF